MPDRERGSKLACLYGLLYLGLGLGFVWATLYLAVNEHQLLGKILDAKNPMGVIVVTLKLGGSITVTASYGIWCWRKMDVWFGLHWREVYRADHGVEYPPDRYPDVSVRRRVSLRGLLMRILRAKMNPTPHGKHTAGKKKGEGVQYQYDGSGHRPENGFHRAAPQDGGGHPKVSSNTPGNNGHGNGNNSHNNGGNGRKGPDRVRGRRGDSASEAGGTRPGPTRKS